MGCGKLFIMHSRVQSEHVKKSIQKILKEHGLDIIIQCNMKSVNHLDVIFNLMTEFVSLMQNQK